MENPKATPITDRSKLNDLVDKATEQAQQNPWQANWRDPNWQSIDPHVHYTIGEQVSVDGIAPFGFQDIWVNVAPNNVHRSRFGINGHLRPIDPAKLSIGWSNIRLNIAAPGQPEQVVGILEHPLALSRFLNLDWNCITQNRDPIQRRCSVGIPNFPQGIATVLEAISPDNVVKTETAKQYQTVKEPVAFRCPTKYGWDGYIILLPAESGQKKLTYIHGYKYPNEFLGETWFTINDVTPDIIAFAAKSRTHVFNGSKLALAKFIYNHASKVGITRLPYLAMDQHNMVIVDPEQGIINQPNTAFDDDQGNNWEVPIHQFLDKMGALELLPQSFVGTAIFVTTHHDNDVPVMQQIVASDLLENV